MVRSIFRDHCGGIETVELEARWLMRWCDWMMHAVLRYWPQKYVINARLKVPLTYSSINRRLEFHKQPVFRVLWRDNSCHSMTTVRTVYCTYMVLLQAYRHAFQSAYCIDAVSKFASYRYGCTYKRRVSGVDEKLNGSQLSAKKDIVALSVYLSACLILIIAEWDKFIKGCLLNVWI
jgi:hypothetical protein